MSIVFEPISICVSLGGLNPEPKTRSDVNRVDSSRLYRITQRQSNTIIHAGGNMKVNCLSV